MCCENCTSTGGKTEHKKTKSRQGNTNGYSVQVTRGMNGIEGRTWNLKGQGNWLVVHTTELLTRLSKTQLQKT